MIEMATTARRAKTCATCNRKGHRPGTWAGHWYGRPPQDSKHSARKREAKTR